MLLFIRQLKQRGTALYELYRYVPPHRVVFLPKNGYWQSALFGPESGMDFEGTMRVFKSIYRFNSKQEKDICEFEMHLKNFFVCALI